MAHARDKQATFTGADQRAGVYVLPYAVAGIFGRGRPRPAKSSQAAAAEGAATAGSGAPPSRGRRRKGTLARSQAARNKSSGAQAAKADATGGALFGGNDVDDDEELPAGFKFDWDVYRAAFGDTPIEDAVTIMFAEYASLYARISGWTTSAKPAPMTLEEGQSIQEQASNFVLNIMTPILGYVHTSKVHKLLAHLMESIRYHGNLSNANTSNNEAAHKSDKKFYRRTNMEIATFTEQLVRQAQGAREVVRGHDAADAHALLCCPIVEPMSRTGTDAVPTTGASGERTGSVGSAPTGSGGAPESGASTGDHVPAATSDAGAAATGDDGAATTGDNRATATEGDRAAATEADRTAPTGDNVGAPTGGGAAWTGGMAAGNTSSLATGRAVRTTGAVTHPAAAQRRSAGNLKRVSISTLSKRPGLGLVGQLFKLRPEDTLPILTTVELSAVFDCGYRTKQLVRASPQFRTSKPWYDCIMYAVKTGVAVEHEDKDGEANTVDGTNTRCVDQREELHIGEVRALVRCREDDYAVVCEFDPIPAEPGCPFDVRECDRLKWAGSAATQGGVIRGVPLSMVRRLVHIVPDFKDLAARKGLQAAPAGYNSPRADVLAMRYFVNAFHPWS